MISLPVSVGVSKLGHRVEAFTLEAQSIRVRILTLGGIITHLEVPDRDGVLADVVLGFDELAPYESLSPYFGAVVGRVGNRIAHGKFPLDGKSYTLAANVKGHHLHGGNVGFDKRVWAATPGSSASPSLELNYVDPDGTEGYPGTVRAKMRYTIADDAAGGGTLRIDYEVTADAPTPINLTNHSYFNLKDAGATTHLDHELTLDCDRYTLVDSGLIPTGEIADVKGTPLDFTRAKTIGRDIAQIDADPIGYDHNLILPRADTSLARCARVEEKKTGRVMECWTTEPAVQFYTGNFLDGTLIGKRGDVYRQYSGFCLETQHYPDSVNHPGFPSTILRPGAVYRSTTEYRFATLSRKT